MDDARRKSLIDLLRDDDDRMAGAAMHELLRCDAAELDVFLAEYQDSADPVLRKRLQQLSSTVTLRRRRRDFLALTEQANVDLAEGLIEVHLQWFDNDARPGLQKLVRNFIKRTAERYRPNSLERLGYFFRKNDFHVQGESSENPDFYCVGVVLEDREGAASLLAALAKLVAIKAGLTVELVRVLGEFALADASGRALLFHNEFRVAEIKREDCEVFDDGMLLRFASSMLFTHAVVSDSFRYVQTVGQSLAGTPDEVPLDFLPYPYSSKTPETRRGK